MGVCFLKRCMCFALLFVLLLLMCVFVYVFAGVCYVYVLLAFVWGGVFCSCLIVYVCSCLFRVRVFYVNVCAC